MQKYLISKPVIFWAVIAMLLAGVAGTTSLLAHAQEAASGGQPANIQKGPTPEQIAAFEQEQGAPLEAFNQGAVEPPNIPEPETIPDDVKKLVPEKDLINLYCAMVKWKSVDFFLAMDALKKNLIPAIEQARAQGVNISAPDIAALTAEGAKRVAAVCAAKTIGEAEQQAKDFSQWGRDTALASMTTQRTEMETQMRALGDGIRGKVKTQLQPFIDSETASVETDIKAKAEAIAQSVVAPYQGQQAPGSSPPDPAVIQSQVEAAIAAQLGPIIEAKKADIESKIKAKAEEFVAPEKKKLESIAALFQGLDKKINDAIKTGAGRYAIEKKSALTLRRNLIVKLLDLNIAEATKQLDANSGSIEQARQADPSVKSVADLKAELAQDRKDFLAKIDAALANEDEAGLALALNDFSGKWEKIQAQAEKAAAEPVGKICGGALPQFTAAKAQIQPGLKQIQDLLAQCVQSSDEACVQVNGLADRLMSIQNKMNDLLQEMDLAQQMCQAGDTNPDTLMALMQKIQTDGQDAMIFGQALDADRSKIVANSVKTACDQALPQLQAARVQIQNEDLVVLKNNLEGCTGKTDEKCRTINDLQPKFETFKSDVATFLGNTDKVTALCRTSKDDADFDKIFSTLNDLNDQGGALMAQANDLEVEQTKSTDAMCAAVTDKMADVKVRAADGRKQMADIRSGLCGGNPKAGCTDLLTLSPAMSAVDSKANEIMMSAVTIENGCKNPVQSSQPGNLPELLDKLQRSGDDLGQLVDALKSQADKLKKGSGIWIEAEQEQSSYIKPVNQRPAVNMKETNPAWRPPYFGTGDWYLATEGEWLGYTFTVPKAGTYNVWVRDYVDKYQPRGVRRIIIDFDKQRYAVTAETTAPSPGDRGTFGWHKVGSGVKLTAGAHALTVTKEKTTSGAALLDAYYLTTGTDVPPEK